MIKLSGKSFVIIHLSFVHFCPQYVPQSPSFVKIWTKTLLPSESQESTRVLSIPWMITSQLQIFLLHAWNDPFNDSTPNSVFLILAEQREMKMVLMFHFFASLSYYNNFKITRMKTKINLSLLPQCVLKQIKRLICSPDIASWNVLVLLSIQKKMKLLTINETTWPLSFLNSR